MKDKVIDKDKCVLKLNNDAVDVHERFFDEKSEQIDALESDYKHHFLSSESKIRVKDLMHAVLMQVIEKAIEKSHDCPEKTMIAWKKFENPAEIEPEFAHHIIMCLEECEKQIRILSGNSDEKLEIDNMTDDNIDLDVFYLKEKSHVELSS